jgi:putative membrane protein
MNAGRIYSLKDFLVWTRRDIYLIAILTIVPTILYEYFELKWIAIPWVPIALIGTAAAFIVGFKNTQSYNRLWEARQIYGAVVNKSGAWGILVKDFVKADSDENTHQQLIYRHIAWLTVLRYQLRESRNWENTNKSYNKEYAKYFVVPEKVGKMEDELGKFLSPEEEAYILSKKNRATHIISLQSKHLRELKEKGLIEPLNYIELENMLVSLYEQQGKCERIKNFPYPRQFASINMYFVRLFIIVSPLGMLKEFEKLGDNLVWLTIPFSIVVSWVFSSMEKIGESTENPFEGGANDIPITSMSRNIEIDLRQMLDEKELPPPILPMHDILM